jgi:predicted nuclease of predicted toxin-antitoxin system
VDEPRADLLLNSPLGRQFILQCLGAQFRMKLFGALGLGLPPGVGVISSDPTYRSPEPSRTWQEVGPDEVSALLASAVGEGEWRHVLGLDELDLLALLARTTSSFGHMGRDEAEWSLTALAREELRPIAQALMAAPSTQRWWEDVRRHDQRVLWWEGTHHLSGAAVEERVREEMAEAAAQNEGGLERGRRPLDDTTLVGASWWSMPFALCTTGSFGDVPSIALVHFTSMFLPHGEHRADVLSMQISADARVLEVRSPLQWAELVRRFPRDVTGTHDGEWRQWGGVSGPWVLPAWDEVMEEWDGVHVTIGGYVASCGIALPVDGAYTMLAGWIPDGTVWLRDVTVGERLLGRWTGDPGRYRSWKHVQAGWEPAGEGDGEGSVRLGAAESKGSASVHAHRSFRQATVRGTRIRADLVADLLAGGSTIGDLIDEYPSLVPDAAVAGGHPRNTDDRPAPGARGPARQQLRLDEELGCSVAVCLREAGFDVDTVSERATAGASRAEVLDGARQDDRVLVTLDSAFFVDVVRSDPGLGRGIAVLHVTDEDLSEELDRSYDEELEDLQRLRRRAAELATARVRLTLQIEQLESVARRREVAGQSAAENGEAPASSADIYEQIDFLRPQVAELRVSELSLVTEVQRRQASVEVFRTNKEVVKSARVADRAGVIADRAVDVFDAEADIGRAEKEEGPSVRTASEEPDLPRSMSEGEVYDHLAGLWGPRRRDLARVLSHLLRALGIGHVTGRLWLVDADGISEYRP